MIGWAACRAARPGAKVLDFRGQAGEGFFLLEDLEAGQGGGAAEGVGGVTVAVVERPLRRAEEGVVNLLPVVSVAAMRQVAAGESLGEAEEIRNHVFVLAGEHLAGAAEAGHDFVEDQVDAGFIAPGPQCGEHAGVATGAFR